MSLSDFTLIMDSIYSIYQIFVIINLLRHIFHMNYRNFLFQLQILFPR